MATTRANLDLTQYVRVTSDPLTPSSLVLQSHRDTVRIVFSDVKPAKSNTVFHELGGEHPPLNIPMTETAVWALAMTERSALTVTEQRVPVEISERGGIGIGVYLQDQTTDMLDLIFLEEKATGLSLAVDTGLTDRTVTLAAAHGLTTANSSGHILEISNNSDNRFYQGEIMSVVGDVVTVAPPIGNVFTIADSVLSTGNPNMCQDNATGVAIDGSVTPVIFTVKPLPSQSGDITRITIATTSRNESDLTTFGGAPELDIGLLLRYKRQDGTFKNLYNYRKNFDMVLHGFDSGTFAPKGGNAIHGFASRISFAGQDKHGVAVRLDGTRGEELQIIINELMDNTNSGNLSVSFNAEGSELQE